LICSDWNGLIRGIIVPRKTLPAEGQGGVFVVGIEENAEASTQDRFVAGYGMKTPCSAEARSEVIPGRRPERGAARRELQRRRIGDIAEDSIGIFSVGAMRSRIELPAKTQGKVELRRYLPFIRDKQRGFIVDRIGISGRAN
jgi:hypothetical protein